MLSLHYAKKCSESKSIRILFNGVEMSISEKGLVDIGILSDGIDTKLIQKIADVDRDCPYPIYILNEDKESIMMADKNQCEELIADIRSRPICNKPLFTTVHLLLADGNNEPFHCEILVSASMQFSFNALKITSDEISQDKVNEMWEDGVAFKLECSFSEDIYELAGILRDWAKDLSEEFPFGFSCESAIEFIKSHMTMTHEKVLDKVWYRERRTNIILRPIQRTERYLMLKEHWELCGDDARAVLANELLMSELDKGGKST